MNIFKITPDINELSAMSHNVQIQSCIQDQCTHFPNKNIFDTKCNLLRNYTSKKQTYRPSIVFRTSMLKCGSAHSDHWIVSHSALANQMFRLVIHLAVNSSNDRACAVSQGHNTGSIWNKSSTVSLSNNRDCPRIFWEHEHKKTHLRVTLQWRHNECDGVTNHRRLDCLHNRLSRRRSKNTSKVHDTGLCEGNSPVTGEFPAQRTSDAENDSIWWRHHETRTLTHPTLWEVTSTSLPINSTLYDMSHKIRFCDVLFCCSYNVSSQRTHCIHLPKFVRVASLVHVVQLLLTRYRISELILKDMGKIHQYQTKPKFNKMWIHISLVVL